MITVVTIDSNGGLLGFTRSDKTLEELKEIREVNGAACYEISDAEYEMLVRRGNCVITDGIPVVSDASAEELERQRLVDIRARRQAEYPSIGDQLDALWKHIGSSTNTEAQAIIDKINAVKAKYPEKD